MKFTFATASLMAILLQSATARAEQKIIPFLYTNDIQTGLIAQFPVGKFTPSNSYPVTFYIPTANIKRSPPKYNFWDNGKTLTINLSVNRPTAVYTLMNAYAPPQGYTIATVEFKGSKGADVTFSLVAGTNIRDFCQNIFANTINGTTTQNAFTVANVKGSCSTGNVKTGYVTTYRVDEQQFLLPTFSKQKLTQIIITPTGSGTPIMLGLTVAY